MALLPSKSTIVSDLVLGVTCLWALYTLQGGTPSGLKGGGEKTDSHKNNLAKIWFVLMLTSSAVGAFRFVKRGLFDQLAPSHDLVSWLVIVIGLPCLVAQFYLNSNLNTAGNLHLLLILPPVLSWLAKNESYTNRITSSLALFAILSLAGNAIYAKNWYQLVGTLLMIFSSQIFDLDGSNKLGLPPIDWLHYGLAASNILLVPALCHSDLPGLEHLRHWSEQAASSMFA